GFHGLFSFLLFGISAQEPLSRTSLTGGTQPPSDPLSNSSSFSWPCSFRLFNLNRYDLNMQPLPAVRVSSRYGYLCQLLRCFCPCLQVRLGFHCSPPALRQPAFKFVFVFIAFLLSHYLKAVLRPIADTLNSIAEDCLESVVLNGPFTDWVPREETELCLQP